MQPLRYFPSLLNQTAYFDGSLKLIRAGQCSEYIGLKTHCCVYGATCGQFRMITRLHYGATTLVDTQIHLISEPYSIDFKSAGFSNL